MFWERGILNSVPNFSLFSDTGQGNGFSSIAQIIVIDVGVDLGCIQMIVSQNLLQCSNINTVLEHLGCRSVAQFMAGILGTIQACSGEVLLYQFMYSGRCNAFSILRSNKKSLFVNQS